MAMRVVRKLRNGVIQVLGSGDHLNLSNVMFASKINSP